MSLQVQSPARDAFPSLVRGIRAGAHSFLWTGHFTGKEELLFAEAAQCGFDGVEIALSDPGAIDWRSVASLADRYSLRVMLCATQLPGLSLASGDADVRAAAVQHISTLLDRTRELGSGLLTGPLLNPVGALSGVPPTAAEFAALREGLSAVAGLAEQRGVRIAIEPLNRFQGYLMTRVEDGLRLCEAVGSAQLGLLLDLFHMNIEEDDPAASIRRAAERCFHVHVSSSSRGAPGTDAADWPALRAALEDIGYAGWITVEAFCFSEADAVAKAHLWHPPAATSLQTAQRSIDHLRHVFGTAGTMVAAGVGRR